MDIWVWTLWYATPSSVNPLVDLDTNATIRHTTPAADVKGERETRVCALVQEAAVAREETYHPGSLSLRDAGGGDRDSTPISLARYNNIVARRLLSSGSARGGPKLVLENDPRTKSSRSFATAVAPLCA